MNLDSQAVFWLQAHRIPALTQAMIAVSFLFSGTACFIESSVLSLILLWKRRARDAGVLFGGTVIGSMIAPVLKTIVRRPRPFATALTSYSFPSSHALSSTVLFGLLAWMASRRTPRWRIYFFSGAGVGAALVDFSRVYLGAHYPTDVIGGNVLGVLFLIIWLKTWEASY